jgi:hypothetical protein
MIDSATLLVNELKNELLARTTSSATAGANHANANANNNALVKTAASA